MEDSGKLTLLGVMVGPWTRAFENWAVMARRYGWRHRILGRATTRYVPHLTKVQCLLEHCSGLPRSELVCYLDGTDGFVCDAPQRVLAAYRAYGRSLVFGAERGPYPEHEFPVPDPVWRWANAGAFVGEAGVVADGLSEGHALGDWENHGFVCDQHAFNLFFHHPKGQGLATVDHRREIVANVAGGPDTVGDYARHRQKVTRGRPEGCSSILHFFGGNRAGYNRFARLYGLLEI